MDLVKRIEELKDKAEDALEKTDIDDKLKAKAGEVVTLDASKSVDAEGDKLAFLWWVQPEASSYENNIDINNVNGSKTSVRIPEDAKGKTIHIICEVTDNGKIPLTSYARVIINVE